MVTFFKRFKTHSNLETIYHNECILWQLKKPVKQVEYAIRQIAATKTKYIENIMTGECVNHQRNHAQNISVLLYLSSTHELISGSLDFTIKVWDLHTGLFLGIF
jgi:WD40 repeat protein